jgi:hypothetical protein
MHPPSYETLVCACHVLICVSVYDGVRVRSVAR